MGRAGLCFLPFNTAYRRDEPDTFLRDAEPRAVVCRPSMRETFAELTGSVVLPHLFTLDEHGAGSLADAAAGAALDGRAVVAAPRSRIAHFKVPRRVLLVEELPRNEMGKVRKADLQARLGQLGQNSRQEEDS